MLSENGYGKRTDVSEYSVQNRGGMGLKNYNVTDKTGPIADVVIVHGDEDLLVISDDGTIIRMEAGSISLLGRATQGVIVMRFKEEGDSVISMALTEHEESEE